MPDAAFMVAAYQNGAKRAEALAEDSVGDDIEMHLQEAARFEHLAVLLHDMAQEQYDALIESAAA